MNCRDFDRLWHDRFDGRDTTDPAFDHAIEAHAASCQACRALGSRYQTLGRAVLAWAPVPPPPLAPDFADRVLAAVADDRRAPRTFRILPARWAVPLASAAALVAAFTLGLRAWGPRPDQGGADVRAADGVRVIDPADLTDALADATSVTLGLARDATAPAARVGGEVLGAAGDGFARAPEALALPASVVPDSASAVWRDVGDRVNAGVRPLSGSARSAFGFLLSPPEAARERPRTSEGS